MRNVVAVLLIAAGAIAALTLTGGGATTSVTTPAPSTRPAEQEQAGTRRWEYRVVSTRVAPRPQAKGDPGVRFVGWGADAHAVMDLERELNRLGGEGWEMCSAAGDGTMVFRRAK